MPDSHVISALEDKAHGLRSAIVSYEQHLKRTRQEGRDGHLLTGKSDSAQKSNHQC